MCSTCTTPLNLAKEGSRTKIGTVRTSGRISVRSPPRRPPWECCPTQEIGAVFPLDPATGWLSPGRHDAELADIWQTFAPDRAEPTRWAIRLALEVLLNTVRELIPSGFLMISGTFVSTQPGPCDMPTVAVVPHDPTTLTAWTDVEEERFQQHLSRPDVIVGGPGEPEYLPVLHPISGALEVLYAEPDDADQLAQWVGSVLMTDGNEAPGARGVVEVEW